MSELEKKPVRILVVDDEPDLEPLIRQRFRKQIQNAEFEFIFAANGEDALRCIQETGEIEIVLTDLNMPEMDGLTLLSHLSRLDHVHKAVVISAYGDLQNIRVAMNRGAFDFLTKPIDFRDLELTIEKTLRELHSLKEGLEAQHNLLAVQHELSVAAQIQQSFLPKQFPPFPDRTEIDIFAQMLPARSIGGDFYDFYFIDQDQVAFVVGDVSGKGVPAALFMAVTRTLLKAVALTRVAPAACLERVNQILCVENASDMFVTMFYGIVDLRTGAVAFSNAGHYPPYILREGAAPKTLPNQGGVVLGVLPDQVYEMGTTSLDPGDTLFLFTDGVTEAGSDPENFFGEKRLEEHLAQHWPSPLDQFAEGLIEEIKAYSNGAPQHDDITTLLVQYKGPAETA
jgi:sigma-B regulation protein RsbU (phosphoserine phosphatase)